MRVIVAGSSSWTDRTAIHRELVQLPPDTTIIYGDAAGADALAGEVAAELGLTTEPYRKEKQDYERFRRGAWKGLNERMLDTGAELVLAFHPDLKKSRGTKHLVQLAERRGIPVKRFAN